MPNHRSRLPLAWLLPLLLAGPVRGAEEGQPGALLLRNGEIFQGQISTSGGEFRIVLAYGELRFRAADVECVAPSLREIYLRKQTAVIAGDAQERLRLAQWCIRQGLFEEAAAEIAAARAIDPRNPAVDLMAHRMELARQPGVTAKAQAPTQHAMPGGAALADLDRLARGLPSGTIESFTERVQPVMMNNCASAACHGPQSPSKLQLLRVPGGRPASRRLTQRNIQNLLPWINREQPGGSDLLKYASTAHASGKAPPLAPESAQYRRLMEWVYQVAHAEDKLPAKHPNTRQADRPANSPGKGHEAVLTGATMPADTGKVHRDAVHAGGPPPATDVVPATNVVPATDPFDPEMFNRRFLKD